MNHFSDLMMVNFRFSSNNFNILIFNSRAGWIKMILGHLSIFLYMVFGRIHCIARGLECPFYFGSLSMGKDEENLEN